MFNTDILTSWGDLKFMVTYGFIQNYLIISQLYSFPTVTIHLSSSSKFFLFGAFNTDDEILCTSHMSYCRWLNCFVLTMEPTGPEGKEHRQGWWQILITHIKFFFKLILYIAVKRVNDISGKRTVVAKNYKNTS